MADVNANIGVNIDTSDALNQLKNLQRQISQFHQSVARTSATAAASQKDLQKNFINSINSIEGFSAELKTVRSTAESFTDALEKNKFSMRQYFRYSAGATKTFGKNFVSEFNTIERTAIERVKTLQTQYVKMGRDATGAMQAIAIRPTVLNMKDLGTQTAIAAQKQVLFNQLVKQGSTNLLNFGKNTQWAGRQLMVGFTIPLAVFGSMASQTFMKLEEEMIKFKKVYGDLLTNEEETKDAIDQINRLAEAYTKYGVSVTETFRIAGDAAAAGFSGLDLQRQTEQAIRLSILGQLDQQKALETTISLQNAFRLSSDELAQSINFLNAVENQSVVALDDITTAIPKVAPVIQALGGNVKDLAFFIAAMKESGVNAAEGANALKSSLGRLVNPSKAASDYLRTLGINIRGIVDRNAGDLQGMIFEVGQALDTLDPLTRSRAIERLFGKFQFARMSALFDNINREGSQAARVLDLSKASIEELSDAADKELGVSAASAMNEFRGAVERLNIVLAPIGELFLKIATPFVEFATKVLDGFNKLPEGMKKSIGLVITIIGGIAPIALMAFGLVNNLIANIIKFFATSRIGYLKLTGQAQGVGDEIQYMTQEHMEAAAAAASLDQAHSNLIQRFTAEKVAVDQLRTAYEQAAAAGARFATINPGMMRPGFSPTGYNKGGVVSVGGTGNKDTQPALLTPGEAVIPAGMVKKYQPLIQGMIAGNIPGYADGVMLGMPKTSRGVSKHRDAAEQIYEMFLKSSYANTIPTEYGHQISPTSGHSFPIFGLGGVYQKGNKQVFVKPVLDEKAAIAEMRSNEISRKAHGLEAPEQRIVVIRDPLDLSGKRRFLALESDLDPKFVNEKPMGLFNEDQYFRQLVASLLRVDKDLSGSNVFGNVVADAGPAGVFGRASGLRDYEQNLPSMEDQAIINLLGIRGGAKRAFAESTLGLMAGLTPEQYHQRMLGEIQKVIPALQQTIASFQLTDPTEVGIYDDMVRRLQEGLGVDWSKFHAIHSAVKIPKPKAATQAVPQGFANGGMVRGPGGPKDDAIPANLSNGEAVIDAATVKKNPGIVAALFDKKKIQIPGYAENNGETFSFGPGKDIQLGGRLTGKTSKIIEELRNVTILIEGMDDVLYNALKNLGRSINPSNLNAALAADPALELLRSPVIGKGRKTGSQGAVKMHAGGSVVVENIEDLRGVVSDATMNVLKENNATQVRLLQDMVFGGPAAANKGRLTGTEFAGALDSDEGKDAFMRYIAEAGNIPPNDPGLRTFAESVREKLLNAGSAAIDDPQFGQIIEESLQEEIYDVGKNTAQVVKDAFEEAKRYSAISSSVRGPVGRDLKLLPNQTFSAGDQQIESITRTKNYTEMLTPEADDILFDNITLEIVKERAIAAGNEVGRVFAVTAGEAAIDAAKANSPSKETVDASDSLVEGVTTTIVNARDEVVRATEEMLSPITQATKNASGSSFGNINTKEPVPAVGNAPREIVSAMTEETTAARTFAGDIKASFANARSNIATEVSWIKEEFQSIIEQIKQKFTSGGQEIAAIAERTNQGLIVNGEEYGFNAIAQAQGRDGAIEAIVTKKNAELISKVTAEWNAGSRVVPQLISDGLKSKFPEFEFMGKRIGTILAENSLGGTQEASSGVAGISNISKVATKIQQKAVMTQEQATAATQKQTESVQQFSSKLSGAAFGLSAVTGIFSMFGGQFSEFAGAISGLTGAMFALMQITNLVVRAKGTELILNQVNAAGGFMELFRSLKGATGGLKGFGKGISGLVGVFRVAFPLASKLIPILGALALAYGTFTILSNIQKDNERKMRGFGAATNMASDKLQELSAAAGNQKFVAPQEYGTKSGAPSVGQSTAEKEGAVKDVIEQSGGIEEFKKRYKEELLGLTEGAKTEAEKIAAYTSLAVTLALQGNGPAQVEAIITALQRAAGQTDVEIDFKSLSVYNPDGTLNLDAIRTAARANANAYKETYDAESKKFAPSTGQGAPPQGVSFVDISGQERVLKTEKDFEQAILDAKDAIQQALEKPVDPDNEAQVQARDSLVNTWKQEIDDLNALKSQYFGAPDVSLESSRALNEAVETTKAQISSLTGALTAGQVKGPEYAEALKTIVDPLLEVGDAGQSIDELLVALKVPTNVIGSVEDLEDKITLLNAAALNIDLFPYAEDLANLGTRKEAIELITAATRDAIATQEYNNVVQEQSNASRLLQDEIRSVRQKVKAYEEINATTGDQALAYKIVGNAALMSGYQVALAADAAAKAAGKTTDYVGEFLADAKKLDNLEKKFESFNPTGGASNAIQDAIQSLKEQKEGILNTSKAYAGLRKQGMDTAKAFKFAQDPNLMSAMNAGLKVGSKQWDEIIQRIKQAEAATRKWQRTTVEGRTQVFTEVYGKVSEMFSAQEALLESNNRAATATNRALIETLEAQIEGYEKQIGAFQRDLDKIVEKEDEINKTYDKKIEALETVKKINQDILNQQKSQLSVADALSRGDVSAAASAMQEARAQNAAAQGDAARTALEAAKKGELESLKENGLTRAEIEAKIKKLKSDISTIEFGSLQTAKDAVEEADKALEKAKQSLTVNGLTREAWEAQKASIDVASSRAALYKKQTDKALESVEGITREWNKLNGRTITTYYQSLPASEKGKAPNKKAAGGYISGPGTATSDSIPAMLSDGEYVIRAASVNKFGKNFLDAINAGKLTGFRLGDLVSYMSMGGMIKLPKREAPPPQMSKGGMVPKYFAGGGMVPKYFGGGGMAKKYAKGGDVVPAMLTPGEFVMSKSATDAYAPLLNSLNSGALGNLISSRQFNKPVYNMPERDYASLGGSAMTYSTSESAASPTAIDNSVYNYSLSVNVEGTDASANDIANVVINKIKNIQSQQVRRQVLR